MVCILCDPQYNNKYPLVEKVLVSKRNREQIFGNILHSNSKIQFFYSVIQNYTLILQVLSTL